MVIEKQWSTKTKGKVVRGMGGGTAVKWNGTIVK